MDIFYRCKLLLYMHFPVEVKGVRGSEAAEVNPDSGNVKNR